MQILLEGFEFNKNAPSSILKQEYAIDTEVQCTFLQILPMIPEYATHVRFSFACAVIDAVMLTSKVKFAEQQMISVDAEMADVELTLDAYPT